MSSATEDQRDPRRILASTQVAIDSSRHGATIMSYARADDTKRLLEALVVSVADKSVHLNLAELRDDDGHTAIHWAAIHANRPALSALLAVDAAAVDARSAAVAQKGQTPLHWAAVAGHAGIVAALVDAHNAKPDIEDDRGYNGFIHAAQYGHIDVCHVLLLRAPQLLKSVDKESHTALHWAAYFGHHRIAVYLLRVHASSIDMNARDLLGFTPLHRAAQQSHDLVCRALLVAGADRTVRDASMRTALDIAPPSSRARASLLEADELAMCRVPRVRNADRLPTVHPESSSEMRKSRASSLLSMLLVPRPTLASLRSSVVQLSSVPGIAQIASWVSKFNLGPRKSRATGYWLIAIYYLILIVSYSSYLTYVRHMSAPSLQFDILFHIIGVTSVMCANICTFRSPGYIPQGTVDGFLQYLNDAIAADRGELALSPSVYCYTCFTRRLPRSVHSREVDRCVMRFDHVCPFVNNQIGLRNHRALVLYAGSVAITQWMFLYASVTALHLEAVVAKQAKAPFINHPVLSLLLATHVVLSVFAATLFVSQLKLILKGATTYEYLNNKRMKQTRNPYDEGWIRNLISFILMSGPGTLLESKPDASSPSPISVL